ncbi:MAG TPA: hypothetical protein VFI22_06100 [Thermomicrobiales bacterium]|nr:hypothetical protein [Thermomicrobiales bacterium]
MIAILLAPIILMGGGALISGALLAEARAAYIDAIVVPGKEPAFFLTLAFLLTFGAVRLITTSIHDQKHSLFHNVTTRSGLHIHHLVPGLVLTLVSGYLGLVLPDPRPTRLLAVVFGIGAALVLDEFALVLRLADVYWEPEGRESIDAVVLASGIAVLYLLGFGFWPRLIEALARTLPA